MFLYQHEHSLSGRQKSVSERTEPGPVVYENVGMEVEQSASQVTLGDHTEDKQYKALGEEGRTVATVNFVIAPFPAHKWTKYI